MGTNESDWQQCSETSWSSGWRGTPVGPFLGLCTNGLTQV